MSQTELDVSEPQGLKRWLARVCSVVGCGMERFSEASESFRSDGGEHAGAAAEEVSRRSVRETRSSGNGTQAHRSVPFLNQLLLRR